MMSTKSRLPDDRTRWGHRRIAVKTFSLAIISIGSGTLIVAFGLLYLDIEELPSSMQYLVMVLFSSAPLGLFLFIYGFWLLFKSRKQGFLVRHNPAEIARAIRSGNTGERRRAAAQLVFLSDAEGRDLVLSALDDNDEEVRYHAIGVLGLSEEGRGDLLEALLGRTSLEEGKRRYLAEQVGRLDPRVKAIKGWSARRDFFRLHIPISGSSAFFSSVVFNARNTGEALPVVAGAIAAGARISMGYDVAAAQNEWIQSGLVVITKDGGMGPALSNSPPLPSRCVVCGKPDPGYFVKKEANILEREYQLETTTTMNFSIPCCFVCKNNTEQDIVFRLARFGSRFRSRTKCPLMMVLQPLDARFIVEMKPLGWKAISEKQLKVAQL